MTIRTASIAGLIAGHIIVIILTLFRLILRAMRRSLGFDDIFAFLSAAGSTAMVQRLLSFALNLRPGGPLQYQFELGVFFLVIWSSRASLLLACHRVASFPKAFAWMIVGAFLGLAVLFTALAALLCKQEEDCKDKSTCMCIPPFPVMFCGLLIDILVDASLAWRNWNILSRVQMPFRSLPPIRRIVFLGFFSNLLIPLSNLVCFAVYATLSHKDPLQLAYLVNSMVIVSVFTTNISIMIGFISHMFKLGNEPIELSSALEVQTKNQSKSQASNVDHQAHNTTIVIDCALSPKDPDHPSGPSSHLECDISKSHLNHSLSGPGSQTTLPTTFNAPPDWNPLDDQGPFVIEEDVSTLRIQDDDVDICVGTPNSASTSVREFVDIIFPDHVD